MVDGGLAPMEGIVVATSGSAAALGLQGVGVVEPGAAADLLVLDGDPLSEPAILLDASRIRLVFQGGAAVGAAPPPR
jgi:imidazolonepropionase-like amidohydrolase